MYGLHVITNLAINKTSACYLALLHSKIHSVSRKYAPIQFGKTKGHFKTSVV